MSIESERNINFKMSDNPEEAQTQEVVVVYMPDGVEREKGEPMGGEHQTDPTIKEFSSEKRESEPNEERDDDQTKERVEDSVGAQAFTSSLQKQLLESPTVTSDPHGDKTIDVSVDENGTPRPEVMRAKDPEKRPPVNVWNAIKALFSDDQTKEQ